MHILIIFPFFLVLSIFAIFTPVTESASIFALRIPENRLSLLLDKRATVNGDGQSAFPATQHHGQHSGAFNAIHVTAAVVGIVAAAAVGITVFVVCRRRMQKKSGDPASPSMKKQHCPSSPSSSKPRTVHVDLLASNYYGENVDRIPSSSLSSPPKTYNDMVSISPPPPPYRP